MGRKVVLLLMCISLASCAMFQEKEPEIVYKPLPLLCPVNKPMPIKTLQVDIEVIQDNSKYWWVALDGASYTNLAINNKEVNRYIKDTQDYADALNSCILSTHKKESD